MVLVRRKEKLKIAKEKIFGILPPIFGIVKSDAVEVEQTGGNASCACLAVEYFVASCQIEPLNLAEFLKL